MCVLFDYTDEKTVGLPVGTTDSFIDELMKNRVCLHSLLLMKNGKVFCEKYAPGFDENTRHRMYSVSKTYVSAAVGVAVGEGLLSMDSKVADYFPDKLPEKMHPYLSALTIRDCLIMATPFNETPYNHLHTDWIEDFFHAECTHRGGTIFHYDTGATLVLDAVIERVTGKHFNEYLYKKVLSAIGYSEVPPCVEAPDGTKWGGSGLLCTTRELASFARLWMNNGKTTDGKTVLPEWYVKEATSKQIGNAEENKHNSFRGYGYGYQIWMIKNGWAMFGMGDQLALCYPKEDFMLICTGDDQGNDFGRNYIVDLIEKYFVPSEPKKPMQTTLSLPQPCGDVFSAIQSKVNGKEYILQPNRMKIEKITFDFTDTDATMHFHARNEEKTIRFGLGHYAQDVFPETKYSGMRINTPCNRGYRCFTSGAWDMPDLLVLKCYCADDYFGNLTMNIRFSDAGIDIHSTKTAEWFLEEYVGFATGA